MKMNSMGAPAVLAVLLIIIGTGEAGEGGVSFWGEKFTMTCPGTGTWYEKETVIRNDSETHELFYEGKGDYYCTYDKDKDGDVIPKKTYYFYVQGKVCKNCFELDATFFVLAIIVDVVCTVIVMMIIYRCTKKKSSPGHQPAKAPPRSGGRAPPVPSPDYEQLNTHTRSKDTYSIVNRTG